MTYLTPEKACPFCASMLQRVEKWLVGDHDEYAVMCTNCGAMGPNDLGVSGAVEMWNMRRTEFPAAIVEEAS